MKLAVFGDSISAGLGARGRQFPVRMAEQLGAELIDLSGTAQLVTKSSSLVDLAAEADLIIIYHGVTEAIVRPVKRSLRYLPRRYRRPGWLDPRPYFSSRGHVRFAQMIESGLRWRLKVLLMRVFGGYRFLDLEGYEAGMRALLAGLRGRRVVVLGGAQVESRYFPHSNESLAAYAACARRVCEGEGHAFVDITDACRTWDDYLADRFHPNEAGHGRIAERVLAALQVSTRRPGG